MRSIKYAPCTIYGIIVSLCLNYEVFAKNLLSFLKEKQKWKNKIFQNCANCANKWAVFLVS